ncbi:MAG: adenosylcobinamide amidohydrolase [Candidatus Methanoplasma sp.]|nr:adenosylcobinamide amidohydrolase [Candidatus Methanoplasma sp.]
MTITWRDIINAEEKEERRLVKSFPCGVSAYRQNRSLIVVPPSEDWRVLSSGNFNGGFTSSPSAVFNSTSIGGTAEYSMMGKPREVHLEYVEGYAKMLGMDTSTAVGLGTAAHMENAAKGSVTSNGIEVSAVITGGIRGNGGRAGDPASFDEMERVMNKSGTIVIILIIDADLEDSALLGAMMTATEAKSRTLMKLSGKSIYSKGIATGSGTDQVAVMCNKGSENKISHYTNGSELADAIKKCVESTLSEALDLQTMMNPEFQRNPYLIISRHKITEMDCHNEIRHPFRMSTLKKGLAELTKDAETSAAVSAVIHIMDEIEWGLIPPDAGTSACKNILNAVISGPSSKDPVLIKRFEATETPAEMLKLYMAMMLFNKASEIAAAEGSS